MSPWTPPTIAAVQVNSTDVFVYAKVENPGSVDLGACDCTNIGPWSPPVPFAGFLDDPNGTRSETRLGVTLTLSPAGDTISYGNGYAAQLNSPPVSPRRAWGWSPDGRFLAYINAGAQQSLTVSAVQDMTLPNGTTIRRGFLGFVNFQPFLWTNADFGWAGSRAALGVYPIGTSAKGVLGFCPLAPFPFVDGQMEPSSGLGSIFVSPCASAIVLPPSSALPNQFPTFRMLSTLYGAATPFRQGNAPIPDIAATGTGFSIETLAHTATGVLVGTGNGNTVLVDDPDCTFVGGGVMVAVDRVKASTLPTANLGVVHVGTAAIGTLRRTQVGWAQVPNQQGWGNQSERHWCLLAQAYTSDLTTVPRAWNGQAMNPPPFPVALDSCAQRNIEILP